jgi:hypothetical protein
MWVSAGLLVAAAACGSNQPDYEELANTALDRANLADVDANYDAGDRVVHVTGTVTSEADRERAGQVVEQAVGTGARVANEVMVEGGHAAMADDLDAGIETRLKNLMQEDPGSRIAASSSTPSMAS